jgi:hypothetical protein
MALSTKMSQLGHYETTRTLGMSIQNVVYDQIPLKMTSLTFFRTTKKGHQDRKSHCFKHIG